MNKNVLVLGTGKIGSLITYLLMNYDDYQVVVGDINFNGNDMQRLKKHYADLECVEIDVSDEKQLMQLMQSRNFDAVISSLPFFCNVTVATVAKACQVSYFDLTEDVAVTKKIRELAEGADCAFVPQCGLAPGFVGLAANSLMKDFDKVDNVNLRVGALPQHINNSFAYALTWSTEGLINEYIKPCHGIKDGKKITLQPMQGLETVYLNGREFEAFNTSGGLGSLVELCENKVDILNYKTMRYPGHCEKMRFLLRDLKLHADVDTLKRILERSIPKTYQDMVIVYVTVTGMRKGAFLEKNITEKIMPQRIAGILWSAIQVTTASSLCVIVDLVLREKEKYRGFVFQEQFDLQAFLDNRFAEYYRGD
ncbi:MAG: saccharopine dehydrogenase C-terminal domain-containing protein [Pseudomonadota bacterium]